MDDKQMIEAAELAQAIMQPNRDELRRQYAMSALTGLCSVDFPLTARTAARRAFQIADEMLEVECGT